MRGGNNKLVSAPVAILVIAFALLSYEVMGAQDTTRTTTIAVEDLCALDEVDDGGLRRAGLHLSPASRRRVLTLTEELLRLGEGTREEAAALETAQSRAGGGGGGAIRERLTTGGEEEEVSAAINVGHIPAMQNYAPDPQLHDAGCEGALPLNCDPSARFRTLSGACNNLAHPLWGSASSPLSRFVPAAYADGVGAPRGSYRPTICDKVEEDSCPRCFTDPRAQLPNARTVSRLLHPPVSVAEKRITHMLAQFGQFLDHDVALSPESNSEGSSCCERSNAQHHPACFPILVPEGDPVYQVDCLDFERSLVFCGETTRGVRQQMNALSAFVDASNVYGSMSNRSLSLRQLQGGLLKVERRPGGDFLPILEGEDAAGDERAREQPGLASMHALFLREHNRIAREVAGLRTEWEDVEVFQQTRRIVGAQVWSWHASKTRQLIAPIIAKLNLQMQNIVFSDWLPLVLGESTMKEFRLRPDPATDYYNPRLDPSIRNSFSTAAFRFGHSMIQGLLELFAVEGSMRRVSGSSNDIRIL